MILKLINILKFKLLIGSNWSWWLINKVINHYVIKLEPNLWFTEGRVNSRIWNCFCKWWIHFYLSKNFYLKIYFSAFFRKFMSRIWWKKNVENRYLVEYQMIAMDVGYKMCWWQLWDFGERFEWNMQWIGNLGFYYTVIFTTLASRVDSSQYFGTYVA